MKTLHSARPRQFGNTFNSITVLAMLAVTLGSWLPAHTLAPPRQGLLHEFATDAPLDPAVPVLRLDIVGPDGNPLAARFELRVDNRPYDPATIGPHGVRFISEHTGKHQRLQVNYALGTGTLEVGLPAGARRVEVSVARGLEYRPTGVAVGVTGRLAEARMELKAWSNLAASGWVATDEHLHYERLDPADDPRWLAIFEAEGLQCGHFLVLRRKGANGLSARQRAYGPQGTIAQRGKLIIPGEEFRDNDQGHINLLGIHEIIEPVLNIGTNWPANYDVLMQARKQGAIGGVAHGSLLGAHSTGVVDAVLGAAEFWEIANSNIYEVERWYQLMNCGFALPPAAGTDLPNYPFRDSWQPFLGGVRMYVRAGANAGADEWQEGLRRGEVFVTSGPLLRLRAADRGPGGTVQLPVGGGDVNVDAELSSPLKLQRIELVVNGKVIPVKVDRSEKNGIHSLRLSSIVPFADSGWLAVRGTGERIAAMECDAMAHTAAIRVLVGGKPIRNSTDARALIALARGEMAHYRDEGHYPTSVERDRVQQIFQQAIALLEARAK